MDDAVAVFGAGIIAPGPGLGLPLIVLEAVLSLESDEYPCGSTALG